MNLGAADVLPEDGCAGVLIGRVWIDDGCPGPRPVAVRDDGLHDLSRLAPTAAGICDLPDAAERVRDHDGERLCSLEDSMHSGGLLAPCDLQAVKACGVTFADSMIERVIEERAGGDLQEAARLRAEISERLGGMLNGIEPGSSQAAEAKRVLLQHGLWSQYLEVGIGPDAEIFTKAQPLSAVGCGAAIGVHPRSTWSNSEPEIVLVINSRGAIVGATLGNDLNLRDFEGRSALLLGRAKDNNASCAIGPFIRLFDGTFMLDDVRSAVVRFAVEGPDGYREEGTSDMRRISRDPEDLVHALIGPEHQYPDGAVLFLGTMFSPGLNRNGPGSGFTHLPGDTVRLSSPKLGVLHNTVTTSDRAPPWTFGIRALMTSLAARGLLQ
jgi:fumarylacetoacetate (FAA) hydrolase family protein